MTMTKYGGSLAKTEVLNQAEFAVLNFLREHAGMKFSSEEVGREVRPLVVTKGCHGKEVIMEPRVIRNWASLQLNNLYRKHLVRKEEATKKHGELKLRPSPYGLRAGETRVVWWIEIPSEI